VSEGRRGRTPNQIRTDRAEIAGLYLEEWTQADIGTKLGLSRQQIGYDSSAVRQDWLPSSLMDFNAKKAEELAKIDRVESEYWSAWGASKQARHISITEQPRDEAERLKTGDPRYLAGVERCIEARAKILGLHAPTETGLAGQDSGPLVLHIVEEIVGRESPPALGKIVEEVVTHDGTSRPVTGANDPLAPRTASLPS
jgi:hypothetical protein